MAAAAGAAMLATTAGGTASAQSGPDAAAFEIAFGAGAEYGPFSTIGPFGIQQLGGLIPDVLSMPVITGELSGWSATIDGHMTFRPAGPGLFGADAYRLDLGYADGSASYRQPRYGPFGDPNEAVLIPFVDADATGLGAVQILVDAGIEQQRDSFSARPSLVHERTIGGIETATRLGAAYSWLGQEETISVVAIQDFDGSPEFDSRTNGRLSTHGIGPFAAIDLRMPVADGLAFVAGMEGVLAFASTDYDGESLLGLSGSPLVSQAEAADRRSHFMATLDVSAGPEWRPLPNLTISLLGTLGLDMGVPHVVYPETGQNNMGIPVVVGGPAHIGLETLWSAGVRFEAELRF